MFTEEEYKKFLESIEYPSCKIEELLYIKLDKKLNTRATLNSNKQISTLLETIKKINQVSSRTNSFNIENRLYEVLTKKDPYYSLYKELREKVATFKTDNQVYEYIRKVRFHHKKINKNNFVIPRNICDARKTFSESLYYDIKEDLKNVKNYIDIGAGDGAKTYYFGNLIGLGKEDIYGLDFTKFQSVEYLVKRNKNISFVNLKKDDLKYPIKNNSFDLVSSFMVAHHIEDLDLYFKEIHRILRKGKYFLLVEHNNFTGLDDMLADIEHSMYEIVYEQKPNYDFKKSEYTKYYDWITWSMIIEKFNFKLINQGEIKSTITSSAMATSTSYMLFKKV